MILLTALLLGSAELQLPSWMAGCWEQRDGERWSEECWTIPRAGMMMGSGRTGIAGVLEGWEAMQIETVETDDPAIDPMTFYAAPQGQNRTGFIWVRDSKESGITFENRSHDYPQRIRYWREGDDLLAEVSLADGTKAQRWRYKRMGN